MTTVRKYDPLGKNFNKIYHLIPFQIRMRNLTIEDAALVCSNCHRMLHK
ncbi:hypothetical protein DHD32_10230 [Arenibacter sp. TNZ]|nr:hypothetical protein [Arenibacter sp. TNZ]